MGYQVAKFPTANNVEHDSLLIQWLSTGNRGSTPRRLSFFFVYSGQTASTTQATSYPKTIGHSLLGNKATRA